MQLRIDPDDPRPPFRQLVEQLQQLVAGGRLEVGHRLPSVRRLAADLGLANGTVARAYRELEEAGVLETRGRAGTFVARDTVATGTERRQELRREARRLVQLAGRLGATAPEVHEALEEALGDSAL